MGGENPLIGRDKAGEPYVIGHGTKVAEVRAAFAVKQDVEPTAEYLRLPDEAVRAALAYEGAVKPTRPADDAEKATALERAGQLAALLGGILALVYLAGAAVLVLRLLLEDVEDAVPVIGQVPREYILTIGVSQVVLPAVLFGFLYLALRLLQGDNATTPRTKRFGKESKTRGLFIANAAAFALLLVVPVALAGEPPEPVSAG